MNKKIRQIHDKFFKTVMANHDASVTFLQTYLPKNVQNQLDFKSLKHIEASYLSQELEASFADVVFEIEVSNAKNTHVCVLLEHKSYVDKKTCFQVLEYIVRAYLKQFDLGLPLKPIIPLVFYHGAATWEYNDMDYFFENFPLEISQYIPRHSTLFVNLQTFDDEQIWQISNAFLAAALIVQKKYESPSSLINSILRIQNSLEPYLENSEWRSIFVYILQNEKINTSVLKNKLKELPQIQTDKIMSIYDQLIQEGIEKGMEKGIEKGMEKGIEKEAEKVIVNSFKNNIPLDTIRLITGETLDKINDILKKNGFK